MPQGNASAAGSASGAGYEIGPTDVLEISVFGVPELSGTLIVDVSCDEGMGFEFARPTPFSDPTFVVGHDVHYYGVDHSPSYLWNSATWEISEALLPFLRPVLSGPGAWEADETVHRAVEIRDGVVVNPKILSFQRRDAAYPHRRRETPT